jgi:hypothetical protein
MLAMTGVAATWLTAGLEVEPQATRSAQTGADTNAARVRLLQLMGIPLRG